jgi:hypothetical protein
MTQPVRRDLSIYTGLLCRTLDHGVDALLCKPAAAFTAGEYRIISAGVAAERQPRAADGLGQEYLAQLAALAGDRELHAL